MAVLSSTLAVFPTQPGRALESAIDESRLAARASAFQAAMASQASETGAVGPVAATDPVTAADPAAETRRTLELQAPPPVAAPAEGDLILDGLKHLRSSFDSSTSRIEAAMGSGSIDSHMLLEVQVELVRFSLLTDVTSKLTGKSTQAFDTLMKGQ